MLVPNLSFRVLPLAQSLPLPAVTLPSLRAGYIFALS